MDQKQFDAMLSDGETRLTRLKMLYEQWFLGFERVEPAILRKEFEDLLAMLRREQVGNTALRFRLQQLVARHMTFATHWRRVARQIEDGTYQRDVLRARRLREQHSERDNAGPELEVSYDIDLDDELQAALDEVHRAAEAAAAKSQAAAPAALAAQAAPGRALAGAWAAAPSDAPSAAGSGPASLPNAPAASAARSGPQRAISPFALPAANGSKAPAAAQVSAQTATNLLGAIAAANGNGAKPANAARTAAAVAGAAAQPTAAKSTAAQPAAAKGAAARTAAAVAVAAAQPTAAKGATTTAQVAGAPATNGATAKPTAGAAPKPGAMPSASGTAAATPAGLAAAANGAGTAKSAQAAPQRAAAANAAGPKAAPAAASGSAAFSNDDVQRIYTQYLSARKQNSERVDNVKLDSIEKTLRGMLPQLEKKHAGKKIDFEVVVKDGKVALKPVAR
jgi:hypothetical protein